jgi:ferredoxin
VAVTRRLAVDPIRCDGRGLCAELLPERVSLDDWGFPVIDPTPIEGALLRDARRAVQLCPVLALRLDEVAVADPVRR